MGLDTERTEVLFERLDADKNGMVTSAEFCVACMRTQKNVGFHELHQLHLDLHKENHTIGMALASVKEQVDTIGEWLRPLVSGDFRGPLGNNMPWASVGDSQAQASTTKRQQAQASSGIVARASSGLSQSSAATGLDMVAREASGNQ